MWGGEGERNWKRAEEKGNWTGNEGISMFVYVFFKRVGLWGDLEIDGGAGGGETKKRRNDRIFKHGGAYDFSSARAEKKERQKERQEERKKVPPRIRV